MTFYHRKKYLDEFKMRFQKILIKDCKRVPIHKIDFSNSSDKSYHDQVVYKVKRMISLQALLENKKSMREKQIIKDDLNTTDHEIDQLIYEIYGLGNEDISGESPKTTRYRLRSGG